VKSQFAIAKELQPFIRKGDLIQCETVICNHLSHYSSSPFNIAIKSRFNNDPKEVAANFDEFIEREQMRYKVASVYTEMNGFNINPDRWYFDMFAYEIFGQITKIM